MATRISLKQRLRQMTRDELIFALRRTAEGDRTHCREWFEKIDNNRDEVFEILCEESEYLDEAWEKVVKTKASDNKPILFQLISAIRSAGQTIREVVQTEEWLPMAAGVCDDLPPFQELESAVFDGDSVHLTFDRSVDSDATLIGFEGASITIRSGVTLVVTYEDGEQISFKGEDIANGGQWALPEAEKKIQRVELIFNRDETSSALLSETKPYNHSRMGRGSKNEERRKKTNERIVTGLLIAQVSLEAIVQRRLIQVEMRCRRGGLRGEAEEDLEPGLMIEMDPRTRQLKILSKGDSTLKHVRAGHQDTPTPFRLATKIDLEESSTSEKVALYFTLQSGEEILIELLIPE